jgi:hypothetical protein
VLDAARHKFAGAAWEEGHILDLKGQGMHDLPIDNDRLGGPLKDHDDLQEVAGETLKDESDTSYNDDKVLVVMGHSDVDDRAAVRDDQTRKLHVGTDLPDQNVCFALGGADKKQALVVCEGKRGDLRADCSESLFFRSEESLLHI